MKNSYSFREILIVFHDGSSHDYHFIIKELPEKFQGKFTCLWQRTGKYITFTVPIEKQVTWINKNRKKITKTIPYRLQFIDSIRFMASSLSNLVINHAEGINKIQCKNGHHNKKCKTSN